MTTHPEQPVHDLAIRLDEENRRLREALAAARRECDLLRAALMKIRDGCSFSVNRDIPWVRHVAGEALAAPAAGEEGKHG